MNIALALAMASDAHGDRTAVVDHRRSLTYAQLQKVARTVAARLPEDAGALVSAGAYGTAAATCLFGAAWAGRSFAPVNHRLPADQLTGLARRLAPAQGVADHLHVEPLRRALPGTWATDDLFTGTYRQAAAYVEDPALPAVLLYTSTAGRAGSST